MAKYKSVLKTLSVVVARRRRKCYHDDAHAIQKGQFVLAVKDSMYNASCYCSECALQMISHCRKKLNDIESTLRQTT